MRISTLQMFDQPLEAMQHQQAKVQQTELQISTGLRILQPSDDPAAAVKILNLEDNIAVLDQYAKNSSLAQGRLSESEGTLAGIVSQLQRVRELTVQAANASQTPETREAVAVEISRLLDGMVSLANTSDAQGKYIFAGSKDSAPPFTQSSAGVNYVGDQLERTLQIGEGSRVTVRDTGDDVFLRVPSGDGDVEVSPGAANQGSLVVGQHGVSGNFVADNYTISFSQPGVGDPVSYTVTDGDAPPNVIETGLYEDNDSIQIDGLSVGFTGTPQNGDSFSITPSVNKSMFDTVQGIANALADPPTSDVENTRFYNDMNQALNNLDQALAHVTGVRARIGGRINTMEQQSNVHEDLKITLQTVLSDTQDLDYAEAISRFNLQLTSLQAAQQAFVKVQELSLFRYL